MLGMRLLDMEAGDALDVLHVLLEEDSIDGDDRSASSKQRVRRIIAEDLYGRRPESARERGRSSADQRRAGGAAPAPKPYIPPTPVESLPGILGDPAG